MRREGMPQHMRRELARIEAGPRRNRLQFAGEGLAGQVAARAVGREQPLRFRLAERGALLAIKIERGVGGKVERHQPLAPALPPDGDQWAAGASGRRAEARQARRRGAPSHREARASAGGEARPGGEAGSGSGAVSGKARRLKQPVDVFDRKHLRKRPARLRPLGRRRRVVVAKRVRDEELEELAERRKPPRLRAWRKPAPGERRRDSARTSSAEASASRPASARKSSRSRR